MATIFKSICLICTEVPTNATHFGAVAVAGTGLATTVPRSSQPVINPPTQQGENAIASELFMVYNLDLQHVISGLSEINIHSYLHSHNVHAYAATVALNPCLLLQHRKYMHACVSGKYML